MSEFRPKSFDAIVELLWPRPREKQHRAVEFDDIARLR